MKDFFDYHYYRIAKFYFKRDGIGAVTALISVTAVQSWMIINLLLFLEGIYFNENEQLKYYKIIYLVIIATIFFYNKNKYTNKYLEFRKKWKNENLKKRRMKGIIIIVTIIFSWCLIFITGFFFHRYK